MSVTFTINFKATSLANFYDEIGIITDANIFKISLKAEKEEPSINLLKTIVAKSCWVGDRTDIMYRIINRGGPAGFKFFSAKPEEEKKSSNEFLMTENFLV